MATHQFFVIVGSRVSESVASKLTATGTEYFRKSLDSGEDNWREITRLLRTDGLAGTILTLNRKHYERIARDIDHEYVNDLLAEVSRVPHLALIHEAIYGGEAMLDLDEPEEEEWDGGEWNDRAAASFFGVVSEDVRLAVNTKLQELGINLSIYRRNAEASLLAVAFIDDRQDNLLFRIYIPAGRLFEEEGAQLISMFHDWLTSVRGLAIRQDGYETSHGRVIEFHAGESLSSSGWEEEVARFQNFVALVDDPAAAETVLEGMGIPQTRAHALVARYAKQARRLQVDIKYERQRKELAIREQFESELVDEAQTIPPQEIERIVNVLLPNGVSPQGQLSPSHTSVPAIQINQQFIARAEGIVAQHIAGNAITGPEAVAIENLITEHGAEESAALREALRELLDEAAPKPSRVGAKQKLKAFLIRVGGSVEKGAIAVLQKWVESQLGL